MKDTKALQSIEDGFRPIDVLLMAACVLLLVWCRALPVSFGPPTFFTSVELDEVERTEHSYQASTGQRFEYHPNFDSYYWLRQARVYLQTGEPCDAIVGDLCADTLASAPVGSTMRQTGSPHIYAIAYLHRFITFFEPGYPLGASAYWLNVLLAALGVVPAYLLGRLLAGRIAGVVAGCLFALVPTVAVARTLGADNDMWSIVLPLYAGWTALVAVRARSTVSRAALFTMAAALTAGQGIAWRGWSFLLAVVFIGLTLPAALRTIEFMRDNLTVRFWRARAARIWVVVAGGYLVTCFFLLALGGIKLEPGPIFRQVWRRLFAEGMFAANAVDSRSQYQLWGAIETTVDELQHLSFSQVTGNFASPALFAASLCGLCLAVLPVRGWRWKHSLVFGFAAVAYALLAVQSDVASTVIFSILIPPVAAICLRLFKAGGEYTWSWDAGLLLLVWFLAALQMVLVDGERFLILMAPPFALALAVFAGRAADFVCYLLGLCRLSWRPISWVASAAITLAALWMPVSLVSRALAAYQPNMNDAWWDTLSEIKRDTSVDTVVNTAWDYGHWTKFVAERPVIQDGAHIFSRVPYWFARALLAGTEQETLGLLRMLNCGSDLPPRYGPAGLPGLLLEHGLSSAQVHALVLKVASSNYQAATALLTQHEIPPDKHEQLLAKSHCEPPPALLVLTDKMIRSKASWIRVGQWTPQKRASDSAYWFLSPDWNRCKRSSDSFSRYCPMAYAAVGLGVEIGGVGFDPTVPQESSLWVRPSGSDFALRAVDAAPVLVYDGELTEYRSDVETSLGLGVLIDIDRNRVLIASPDLLRSTFVRLMYLGDRATVSFSKFSEHRVRAEAVHTWQIEWPGSDSSRQ